MKERPQKTIFFGISAKMTFAITFVSFLVALIALVLATRLSRVLTVSTVIDKNWVIAESLMREIGESEAEALLQREKDIYFSLSDEELANPEDKNYQSRYSKLKGDEYDRILSKFSIYAETPQLYWVDLRFKDDERGRYVYLMHTNPKESGQFGIGFWEPDKDRVNCDFYFPSNNVKEYTVMVHFPKWFENLSKKLPKSIRFFLFAADHLMSINERNINNRFCILYPIEGENAEEPAGYLSVGEYYRNYQMYSGAFTFVFIIIFLPYIVIVTLVTRWLVKSNIAEPIQKLAKAAVIYGEDDDKSEEDHFSQVNIRSRDEVLLLRDSMADMEGSLGEYMANLKKMTAKQERYKAEMDMSAQIQLGMLPHSLEDNNERGFNISASIKPAKSVGGDFYDFFEIDDDRIGIVMADVSGKGMPAALFMMIAKIILAAAAKMGTSVEDIMKRANRQICANNPELLFVTIWFGIYEVKNRTIRYVNAGHDYPAVYRHSEKRFTLYEEDSDIVIGFDPGTDFVERKIELEPNDRLFLYTDGIPEANNPQGEMYGNERMLSSLDKNTDKSGDEFLKAVDDDVRSFIAEAAQFDDMTMLLLEIR